MNNVQRILFSVYLSLTIFFVIMDNLFPGDYLVRYFKFTIILTLFISAFSIKKSYSEQKIMTIAVLFVVAGDFFLDFGSTLPQLKQMFEPLGIFSYILAYLTLTRVLQKKFRIKKPEILVSLPILAIYIPSLIMLSAYIKGLMFYGAFIFGIVLCYMTWTSICTIFRGYFSFKVTLMLALAGSLIFISDLAVAHSLFNPAYKQQFVPWLENIIWITFIPAWALIVGAISEEDFLSDDYQP